MEEITLDEEDWKAMKLRAEEGWRNALREQVLFKAAYYIAIEELKNAKTKEGLSEKSS